MSWRGSGRAAVRRAVRPLRPERDPLDRDSLAAGDQGVSELVQQDRGEEGDGRDRGHRPVGAVRETLVLAREDRRAQRPDDEGDHDQPGPVRADLDPEDPPQAETRAHRQLDAHRSGPHTRFTARPAGEGLASSRRRAPAYAARVRALRSASARVAATSARRRRALARTRQPVTDRLQPLDVLGRVEPLPAGAAYGADDPVALFPVPQRGDFDPDEPGDSTDPKTGPPRF